MRRCRIFSILALMSILLFSCGEDVDLLLEKGEYDKAIMILKEELSKDYGNTQLRNSITRLYFTNAKRNIREERLDEAERNLERGIIYSDENNPEIKDEYSEILVLLGSRLIATGDREGSVEHKKRFEKGVSLIKRSIPLSENSQKARAILDALKSDEAQRFFDLALVEYNSWLSDRRNISHLTESRKNLNLAREIIELPGAADLDDKLIEAYLTQNIRNNLYDLRLTAAFFNAENGYIALRIRFHNNSGRDIIVNPSQFTLYDIDDNPYKFDTVAARRGNYRGILENFKVNPSRFTTGLLVFNTGIKRDPVMSKMVWSDDIGNTFAVQFPQKNIMEIDFE